MDKLADFLDKHENDLWKHCFPYCYAAGLREGTYSIRSMEEMLLGLELGEGLTRLRRRAELRVDLTLSALWPQVKEQFPINLFPHRLAAGTDVLRAVKFGRCVDRETTCMAQELADALDSLEATMAVLSQKEKEQEQQEAGGQLPQAAELIVPQES